MDPSLAATSDAFLDTIESVINEVQPYFIEEGNEDVLPLLKSVWLKKLNQAISDNEGPEIPVKLTMPDTSVVMISVSKSTLDEKKLKTVLADPVATTIMNLPNDVRSPMLQNYVQQALSDVRMKSHPIPKVLSIEQPGTTVASSVESESRSQSSIDNSSASASNEETEENEIDGGSLNSDDDVTDDEEFATENIVLCQYTKIYRHKNKWKFQLSNGVMNLDGKEYVFNTLNGDAVW